MQFAGYEERLQVCDGSARREMPQRIPRKPNKCLQFVYRLFLHCTGGRAAVERVVVRIDELGCPVAKKSRGMRRLEHLSGVARMKEGIVARGEPVKITRQCGFERLHVVSRKGLIGSRRNGSIGMVVLPFAQMGAKATNKREQCVGVVHRLDRLLRKQVDRGTVDRTKRDLPLFVM